MADDPDLESAYALETPEDNKALYRSWAESYHTDFVEGAGFRLPKLVADIYVAAGGGWPVLDLGCGTGAVAFHLPEGSEVDGLDLSPDMLGVAGRTGLYRNLIEANLKETLPIDTGTYTGLVSSGTFTHGHVGAEALPELLRIMSQGAVAVFSIRDAVWEGMGFDAAFAQLAESGRITPPERTSELIYASASQAPVGHAEDRAFITMFRRL